MVIGADATQQFLESNQSSGFGEILGGVGSVLGGIIGSGGASDAAEAQIAGQRESLAFQEKFLEQNRSDLKEAVDAGLIDINSAYDIAIKTLQPFGGTEALDQAKSLLQDPSQIFNDPTVQFQQQQGEQGLSNLLSRTTGGGLSSDAIKRSMQFGQNFAGTQVDSALNRLLPFINLEAGTASNISNIAGNRGTATSGLRMGGAQSIAGTTSAAIPGISNVFSDIGTIQGRENVAQAGISQDVINSLAELGSGLFSGE